MIKEIRVVFTWSCGHMAFERNKAQTKRKYWVFSQLKQRITYWWGRLFEEVVHCSGWSISKALRQTLKLAICLIVWHLHAELSLAPLAFTSALRKWWMIRTILLIPSPCCLWKFLKWLRIKSARGLEPFKASKISIPLLVTFCSKGDFLWISIAFPSRPYAVKIRSWKLATILISWPTPWGTRLWSIIKNLEMLSFILSKYLLKIYLFICWTVCCTKPKKTLMWAPIYKLSNNLYHW